VHEADCAACQASAERLCPGLLPVGDGRWRRCERRRNDDAQELLPGSGLERLVNTCDLRGIDPSKETLLVECAEDPAWARLLLEHLVSVELLHGRQARFVLVPAWAGRGWEMMRQPWMEPTLVAWAYPDLAQAGDVWIDQMAQQMLARVTSGQRSAFCAFGAWRPRTAMENLLLQEIKGR